MLITKLQTKGIRDSMLRQLDHGDDDAGWIFECQISNNQYK